MLLKEPAPSCLRGSEPLGPFGRKNITIRPLNEILVGFKKLLHTFGEATRIALARSHIELQELAPTGHISFRFEHGLGDSVRDNSFAETVDCVGCGHPRVRYFLVRLLSKRSSIRQREHQPHRQ